MGNDTVPTVEVSLNHAQEKELNIRLNKNKGRFDMDKLSSFFDTEELESFGFEGYELGMEADLDYSFLDEEDMDGDLETMTGDVRKSIQVEFESLSDWEEAKEIYYELLAQDVYVGGMIIEEIRESR
jgi:hypothetical protein